MLVVALLLINSFAVGGDYFFKGRDLVIKELVLKADKKYQISDIGKTQYPAEVTYFDQVELSQNYGDFNFAPQSGFLSLWSKLWGASKECVLNNVYVSALRLGALLSYHKVECFDGYQIRDENSQKRYYALIVDVGYWKSKVILRSYNKYKKHLNDFRLFECKRSNSKIANVALNYPHIAYVIHQFNGWNQELMVHHMDDYLPEDYLSDEEPQRLDKGLKKIAWLKGKNLLALTTDGKVLVIDVSSDPYKMYEQKIAGPDAIDMMAVDTQSPWRVLLFSKVKGLMYLNFGSAGYIVDDAGTTFFLPKKNLTYRTLIPAAELPQEIYRLWFNGNNIGVVSGDYELSTYTLSEHCVALPFVQS